MSEASAWITPGTAIGFLSAIAWVGTVIVAWMNGWFQKDKVSAEALHELIVGAAKEIMARQDAEIASLGAQVITLREAVDVARAELQQSQERERAQMARLEAKIARLEAELEQSKSREAKALGEVKRLRARVAELEARR